MTAWNYRIRERRILGHDDPSMTSVYYDIIEAHYGPDGNEIIGWSEATPGGDTLDEIRADLADMAYACELSVVADFDLPRTPDDADFADGQDLSPERNT